MASETLVKCANPPCECLVEAEQKFCSSACSNSRGSGSEPVSVRSSRMHGRGSSRGRRIGLCGVNGEQCCARRLPQRVGKPLSQFNVF